MTTTKRLWLALLSTGLALTPLTGFAQAVPENSPETSAQQPQNSSPAIPPEQQATKEQVMKLFAAMRVREQAMQMAKELQLRMRQQLWTAAGSNNSTLPLEKRLAIQKLLHEYGDKVPNVYSLDEMLADLSAIYQRHLTREDAEAAIAFYSSAVGQDLLNAQPKIAGEAVPMVEQRSQERGDALTADFKKDLAAIKPQPASFSTQPAKP